MPRYKLTIEYDGAPFVGWQIQDNGPSVQGAIMAAVAAFSGESVMVQGAGRTDAGVHALGQVAHVDLAKEHAPDTVPRSMRICARTRSRSCRPSALRRISTPAARRCGGTIAIASATAVPISRSTAAAPGG